MARIISIVNQKGGTGKSACTANLAVGLAQKNMKHRCTRGTNEIK